MIYKKETFLEIWSTTIEVGNQRKGKLCDLQHFPSENHYKAWVFSLIFKLYPCGGLTTVLKVNSEPIGLCMDNISNMGVWQLISLLLNKKKYKKLLKLSYLIHQTTKISWLMSVAVHEGLD